MRFALCIALLSANLADADPPSGGTPPPVICRARPSLTAGALDDGHYLALEPIDPAQAKGYREKGDKWLHEVTITISEGKVSTVENPIAYRRGRKFESVSEGGFQYYEGCLKTEGEHYSSELRLMRCDYPNRGVDVVKTVSIKPLGNDISVNGKRCRRTATEHRR